jgi:hypothetical protein
MHIFVGFVSVDVIHFRGQMECPMQAIFSHLIAKFEDDSSWVILFTVNVSERKQLMHLPALHVFPSASYAILSE